MPEQKQIYRDVAEVSCLEGDDKTDIFSVLVFCNSGKYQWLKIDTFVHFIGMTATGSRLQLYATTRAEGPVLRNKRLHVMYKFQRDDIVLSANNGLHGIHHFGW